jgi:hypothetical protein
MVDHENRQLCCLKIILNDQSAKKKKFPNPRTNLSRIWREILIYSHTSTGITLLGILSSLLEFLTRIRSPKKKGKEIKNLASRPESLADPHGKHAQRTEHAFLFR